MSTTKCGHDGHLQKTADAHLQSVQRPSQDVVITVSLTTIQHPSQDRVLMVMIRQQLIIRHETWTQRSVQKAHLHNHINLNTSKSEVT